MRCPAPAAAAGTLDRDPEGRDLRFISSNNLGRTWPLEMNRNRQYYMEFCEESEFRFFTTWMKHVWSKSIRRLPEVARVVKYRNKHGESRVIDFHCSIRQWQFYFVLFATLRLRLLVKVKSTAAFSFTEWCNSTTARYNKTCKKYNIFSQMGLPKKSQ